MVDHKDNHVDDQFGNSAWQVPLLLLGGFRAIVDEVHRRLAERGFPGVRAVHGFTLQAVGEGCSVSEVAQRLGISKQAAAKTLAALETEGWVARSTDPADRRRQVVVRTRRGVALLDATELAFEEIVAEWGRRVGHDEVGRLRRALAELQSEIGARPGARLDLGAWSSS